MENNEQNTPQVEETKVEETKEPARAKEPQKRTYTDAEVDEIINKRFAKWQKEQDRKVEEAKRLEQMNAEEKAKYERDALQKELDALKAEKAHNAMAKTAKEIIFNETSIQAQDALADVLVRSTAEETHDAVKAFIAFNDEFTKARLAKGNPKKSGGTALTRDEIFKIKDPNKRLKAIEDNMDLFKKGQ